MNNELMNIHKKNHVKKTRIDHSQTVAIVTDSVAQVPADIARQLNITVIPLIVNIEGKSYRDGVDLVLSELYRRMRTEKIMPTTTAPTPGQYQQTFQSLLRAGAQAILHVSLSSKLSSCYDIACLAAEKVRAEYPDRAIEILDTRKAAICEGFIAYIAARAAAEGKPLAEVVKAARAANPRTNLVATLETLEYLARGGRVGKATYMLGSMINIKPILTIDQEGTVNPVSKVRTESHALQTMLDYVAQKVKGCRKLYLAVLEADAAKQAAKLNELVQQNLQPTEIFQTDFTPVMGVHTGPGLVGLGYYYE